MDFNLAELSPDSQNIHIKCLFRKGMYENTPILHEIDTGQPPDWQSGPLLDPDSPPRDTVGRDPAKGGFRLRLARDFGSISGVIRPPLRKIPSPVPGFCWNTSKPRFGRWLMPVNGF
jgi:hypothetical protein